MKRARKVADEALTQTDEALTQTQALEQSIKSEALTAVAVALAQAGAVDQALRAAKAINESRPRAEALARVATALAHYGAIDDALTAARAIDESQLRAEALAKVAKVLADAGMPELARTIANEAHTTAQAIAGDVFSGKLPRTVPHTLDKAANLSRAILARGKINEQERKAKALIASPEALIAAGDAHGGLGALEEAFVAVRTRGPSSFFRMLQRAAPAFMLLDGGQSLARISDTLLQLETWRLPP